MYLAFNVHHFPVLIFHLPVFANQVSQFNEISLCLKMCPINFATLSLPFAIHMQFHSQEISISVCLSFKKIYIFAIAKAIWIQWRAIFRFVFGVWSFAMSEYWFYMKLIEYMYIEINWRLKNSDEWSLLECNAITAIE